MKHLTNAITCRLPARRLMFALIAGMCMIAIDTHVSAQGRWNIKLQPGINFPTGKFGSAGLNTGYGFEGTAGYRCLKHVSVYAGWGWNTFDASDNSGLEYEETGYTFGFQFIHPVFPSSRISLMAGAGAIYNHVETENSNGNSIHDTKHGFGWQAETGVSFGLSKHLYLIPSLRYRVLSRETDTDISYVKRIYDLNYFSGGLGLMWRF